MSDALPGAIALPIGVVPISEPSAPPFTYDPTTPAGLVRLLIADTVEAESSFDDVEIAAFLALGRGSVYEAAAQAYETWARSRAKVELMVKVGTVQTEREAVDKLLGLAAALRKSKPRAGATVGQIVADGGLAQQFRPRAGVPCLPLS